MRAFVAVRHLILNPPVDEVKELRNEFLALKEYIENVLNLEVQIGDILISVEVRNSEGGESLE